jgi:hypothetical protein
MPSEAEVARFAEEDALDALEYARRPAAQQWPVTTLTDPSDRHGLPQTKLQRRWWQQQDEDWPESLREAYRAALMEAMSAANFALVEQHNEGAGPEWIAIGAVDLERWEPTFPFTPGRWVKQGYGSGKGWRRRTFWRRWRSRRQEDEAS